MMPEPITVTVDGERWTLRPHREPNYCEEEDCWKTAAWLAETADSEGTYSKMLCLPHAIAWSGLEDLEEPDDD